MNFLFRHDFLLHFLRTVSRGFLPSIFTIFFRKKVSEVSEKKLQKYFPMRLKYQHFFFSLFPHLPCVPLSRTYAGEECVIDLKHCITQHGSPYLEVQNFQILFYRKPLATMNCVAASPPKRIELPTCCLNDLLVLPKRQF